MIHRRYRPHAHVDGCANNNIIAGVGDHNLMIEYTGGSQDTICESGSPHVTFIRWGYPCRPRHRSNYELNSELLAKYAGFGGGIRRPAKKN
jgi:hypothetical protein